MSKEQIEEMAKVIEITEQIARDAHCGYPSPRMIASDLYDKGYREQSEIAREIFEEIETIVDNNTYKSYLPNSSLWSKEYKIKQIITELAELKKKYTEAKDGT